MPSSSFGMEQSLPSKPRSDKTYINPNLPNLPNLPTPSVRGHKRGHSNVSSAHSGGATYNVHHEKKKIKREEHELLLASRISSVEASDRGSKKKAVEVEDDSGDIVVGDDGTIRLEKRRERRKRESRDSKAKLKHITTSKFAAGTHPWDPRPRTRTATRSSSKTYCLHDYRGAKDYDGEKMRAWAEESEDQDEHDASDADGMKSPNSKASESTRILSAWLSRFVEDHKDEAIQTSTSGYSLSTRGQSTSMDTAKTEKEHPTLATLSAKLDRVIEETKGTSSSVHGLVDELRRGLDEIRELVLDVKASHLPVREVLKVKREPGAMGDADESWLCLSE